MRPARWFWTVDRLRRRVDDGMATFDLERSGRPSAGRILSLLDSRQGTVSSHDLHCLNHPELRNRDGVIAEVGGQRLYVAAAQLHPDFIDQQLVIDRQECLASMPDVHRRRLLVMELDLIEQDHIYSSDEAWFIRYRNNISQIEHFLEREKPIFDDIMTEAARHPWRALKKARGLMVQASFLSLVNLADTANHCAKMLNARYERGLERAWYQLKDECINALLLRWYAEPNGYEHVEICFERNSKVASVYTAITFPSLGHQATMLGRMLHISWPHVSLAARRVLQERRIDIPALTP